MNVIMHVERAKNVHGLLEIFVVVEYLPSNAGNRAVSSLNVQVTFLCCLSVQKASQPDVES